MITLLEASVFSYPKEPAKTNEDAVLPPRMLGDGYLIGIADGVGSYAGGEKASRMAVETLCKVSINQMHNEGVSSVFKVIKEKVERLADLDANYTKAATTLTFCYIKDNGVLIWHAGDCRAYLKVGRKLLQITKDHTQYQRMIDNGMFTKKYLKDSKAKNILTSAITSKIAVEYDYTFLRYDEFPAEAIDEGCFTIYLMSDGAHDFWEHRPRFSQTTMNNVCRFSNSLFGRINAKGPKDDYSLVGAAFKLSEE